VLLCTGLILAQGPLKLEWDAPAGCPSAEAVLAAVSRRVEREPIGDATFVARARVERTEINGTPRYRVHLRTRRGESTGERSIDAATCEGVAEATAVVLSLALMTADEMSSQASAATAEASAASSSSVAPPGAVVIDAPAASPPPGSTRVPSTRVRSPAEAARRERGSSALAVGLAVAGDAATLPSAAAGGSLSLAWQAGALRLELEGRRWLAQSRDLEAFDAGARFSMSSIGARGCWRLLADGAFELASCAGADVHLVSAPGRGVEPDYDATAEWTAFAAGGQARVFLAPWLAWRVRLEACLPLSRPIFVLEGGGRLHQPAALGGAAVFGVELLFF
jgi:hypothetical protein